MPINSLISYINDNVSFDYPIGTEFDTINDELFVWKYVIKTNISNSKLGVKQPKKGTQYSWKSISISCGYCSITKSNY